MGNYWVDNVAGNDSNDGKLVADGGTGPWATLGKASLDASYDGSTRTINIVNNGWANPYLENTALYGMIQPNFSGSSGDYIIWNCNYAPMLPVTEITNRTWYRLPGTSNVYYCSWSGTNQGLYAWSISTTDDLMRYNGRHYIARSLEVLTDIPNDWEDHCYYYNATASLLYWCDRSGSPSDTGVCFGYRGTTPSCFSSFYPTTQRFQYHELNNFHFYAGKTASLGACVYSESLSGSTISYNRYKYGYFNYDFANSICDFNSEDLVEFCIFTFSKGSALTVRVAGNVAYSNPVLVYNCLLVGGGGSGTNVAFTLTNNGRLKVKNCAILDFSAPFSLPATKTFEEDYNLIGLTTKGSRKQTSVSAITPSAHDVIVEGDTGYSISQYRENNLAVLNLHPLASSLVRDAGTDLGFTLDFDGVAIPKGIAPDIGTYEIQSSKRTYIYYNYA